MVRPRPGNQSYLASSASDPGPGAEVLADPGDDRRPAALRVAEAERRQRPEGEGAGLGEGPPAREGRVGGGRSRRAELWINPRPVPIGALSGGPDSSGLGLRLSEGEGIAGIEVPAANVEFGRTTQSPRPRLIPDERGRWAQRAVAPARGPGM